MLAILQLKALKVKTLLRFTFDDKTKFQSHVENLCSKASRKLYALAHIASYMDLREKIICMNSFFDSQFNFFLLAWMCYCRKFNNKMAVFKMCLVDIKWQGCNFSAAS